uniref:AlNc14C132G6979 protein n=1 Tax=Albugo laibachii Nc14 TaxID=890382 RepID=F0WKC7_9STRA|nr:AlNc14C132G6979 [Albugo laibachii Nc14]|eukprot:CCA21731.1 AlNc14C132G6979 [Albugo laibachii Nc14]
MDRMHVTSLILQSSVNSPNSIYRLRPQFWFSSNQFLAGRMSEETWDDLAIIQAFERALDDQNNSTRHTEVKRDTECKNNVATCALSTKASFDTAHLSEMEERRSKQTDMEDAEQEFSQNHPPFKASRQKTEKVNVRSSGKETSQANAPAIHKGMDFPASVAHYPLDMAEDESLTSLLLSWYRLGYQTGRYQTIQEMKAKTKTSNQ